MTWRKFPLWAMLISCALAWDTPPHRRMTQAAIDTLPPRFMAELGPEAANLVQTYCVLPDRYVELKEFGFRRKGPGPSTLEEMQPFCVRPDGENIHGATRDHDHDLASLVYLFERTIRSLDGKRPADAAKYLGVLAHFIEDSLSPSHSAGAEDTGRNLHSLLERSVPEFTLGSRVPHSAGPHILPAAESILARCYAAADTNRRDMAAMVRAAEGNDEPALDAFRLRAGRAASEIFADAAQTVIAIAGRR